MEQRWRILRAAAAAIQRRGLLSAVSLDARATGYGPRRRGSEDKRKSREWEVGSPSLVVYVKKKLRRQRVSPSREVPKSITLRLSIEGKRQVFAVPTDVRTQLPVPRAHALPLGVLVSDDARNMGLVGSLCTVVRVRDSATLHALTCHHVACLSEITPGLRADPDAISYSERSVKVRDRRMGAVDYTAPFSLGNPNSIDAALISLDGNAAPCQEANYWPYALGEPVMNRDDLQSEWKNATMYSRHNPSGTPVSPATSYVGPQQVEYAGGIANIGTVVNYELLGSVPQKGDSGGAIISGDGRLLAMHIAGADGHGFAIPAYVIFAPNVFGDDTEIEIAG